MFSFVVRERERDSWINGLFCGGRDEGFLLYTQGFVIYYQARVAQSPELSSRMLYFRGLFIFWCF